MASKRAQAKQRQQEEKQRQSTRKLMGIGGISDYCLNTEHGDLVYYVVKPTNVSTMSDASVAARVYSLMNVLKGTPGIELFCTNSRENFEQNKQYVRERLEEESIPSIRALLEKEETHMDQVQIQMATAREFVIISRLNDNTKNSEVFPYLARIEKSLKDQGFDVKRASRDEIKMLLAVYHEQNVTTEHFDDYDGERWVITGDL